MIMKVHKVVRDFTVSALRHFAEENLNKALDPLSLYLRSTI